LAGAVFVLLASALFEPWGGVRFTPRSVGSLGFLIVCGTAIGLAAYTWLLRVTTPAAVGAFSFVNPGVALPLGWAVGDGQRRPSSSCPPSWSRNCAGWWHLSSLSSVPPVPRASCGRPRPELRNRMCGWRRRGSGSPEPGLGRVAKGPNAAERRC